MFDIRAGERLREAAAAVASARIELADSGQMRDLARAVQSAQDSLDGIQSALLAQIGETSAFEDDGAASVTAWARRELRLDPKEARARVAAGRTLSRLPAVREASANGSIRLAHVKEFTGAVTKVGEATVADAQSWLIDVARTCDPAELRETVNQLVDVVHPERLDQAYVDGLDRQDFTLDRVGDGFHAVGFLDIATGCAVKTWLDAAAAPTEADDTRPASERRLTALRDLFSSALAHGMPSDRGVRPQVHVHVELATLRAEPGAPPATLAGFGPIGADLLGYLTCVGDVTPILVDGHTTGPTPQARVLDVGRAHRLATPKQRTAVLTRQEGRCAAPGCSHTRLEIHHASWWSHGGGTDLDNLVGLCGRCHHLVHAHRLTVEPDGHGGFGFRRPTVRPGRLDDAARRQRHAIRKRLRSLARGPSEDRRPPRSSPAPADPQRAPDHGFPTKSILELRFRHVIDPPRPHRRQ